MVSATGKAMDGMKVEAMKQRMEAERIKNRVVNSACYDVINMLNRVSGHNASKVLKTDTSGLTVEKSANGLLKITAGVYHNGTMKQVEVPIRIANSIHTLPNDSVVINKIASMIVGDELMDKIAIETKSRIEDIDKKFAEREKQIAAEAKARISRKAKTVEIPSGGFATSVPSAQQPNEIMYDKANLPEGVEAGDEILISGRKYKVSETTNSMGSKQFVLTFVK